MFISCVAASAAIGLGFALALTGSHLRMRDLAIILLAIVLGFSCNIGQARIAFLRRQASLKKMKTIQLLHAGVAFSYSQRPQVAGSISSSQTAIPHVPDRDAAEAIRPAKVQGLKKAWLDCYR